MIFLDMDIIKYNIHLLSVTLIFLLSHEKVYNYFLTTVEYSVHGIFS